MTEPIDTKILILGAAGMLGSALFRAFSNDPCFRTYGTIRNADAVAYFPPDTRDALIPNINVDGENDLLSAFSIAQPDIVINCVGIIKQRPSANDHLESLAINAALPHRLARYCEMIGARLIHFSTDCVFSGRSGHYREYDFADANDLYGRTKYLGEVDYGRAITLRTSIIGHELKGNTSLLNWFLSQKGEVKGYQRAIFSGLTTVEVARVTKELVIPNTALKGLYHLSVEAINKNDLLRLVAEEYHKDIRIIPDEEIVIDRSLNSDRFRKAAGFTPKPWRQLIREMYEEHKKFHLDK